MKSQWQLLLIAIGLVLITLSPTQYGMYLQIISGLAFIGLGFYLIKKDKKK